MVFFVHLYIIILKLCLDSKNKIKNIILLLLLRLFFNFIIYNRNFLCLNLFNYILIIYYFFLNCHFDGFILHFYYFHFHY
jgi:hypothetical protein